MALIGKMKLTEMLKQPWYFRKWWEKVYVMLSMLWGVAGIILLIGWLAGY